MFSPSFVKLKSINKNSIYDGSSGRDWVQHLSYAIGHHWSPFWQWLTQFFCLFTALFTKPPSTVLLAVGMTLRDHSPLTASGHFQELYQAKPGTALPAALWIALLCVQMSGRKKVQGSCWNSNQLPFQHGPWTQAQVVNSNSTSAGKETLSYEQSDVLEHLA